MRKEESLMKIYIIERDNTLYKPKPMVIIDGMKALEIVKEEYDALRRN